MLNTILSESGGIERCVETTHSRVAGQYHHMCMTTLGMKNCGVEITPTVAMAYRLAEGERIQ